MKLDRIVTIIPAVLGTAAQTLPVSCIQRHIDTGEHIFDDKQNVIYAPFPVCAETQAPLAFSYGSDESVNCTITLKDELYHLFQLYLHKDAPFSCRFNLEHDTVELPININGELSESHLDIDPHLNVLAHHRNGTLVSAVAFSTAHSPLQRAVIDTSITLQFDVKWYQGNLLPQYSSHYYTAKTTALYCIASFAAALICSTAWYYSIHLPQRVRHMSVHHQFGDQYHDDQKLD